MGRPREKAGIFHGRSGSLELLGETAANGSAGSEPLVAAMPTSAVETPRAVAAVPVVAASEPVPAPLPLAVSPVLPLIEPPVAAPPITQPRVKAPPARPEISGGVVRRRG